MKKINIFGWILRYFIQGILMLGPLVTTIWIIWTVFYSIDSLVPNISKQYPGLVFAVILIATTITGFFGSKFLLGKALINVIDYLLRRTPGVRVLYSSIKEILYSFVGDKRKFTNPVWVKIQENPEMWRIGFITQKEMSTVGFEDMVSVYLPHSYAISGWVIIVKKENIKPAEGISAQKAMEFAVSGGTISFS
ncbi:MAG: DUF502 domain-containing protein [Capnocytophaga sp.]|nr:DUF502 domain-containing protein [Capnocytophaga sp.]